MKKRFTFAAVLLVLAVLAGSSLKAQTQPAADELLRTVTALDASLFDAYNRCDLEKLGSMVSEDLEFYHDKTGLAVGRKVFLDAIQQNICGKVHRELVAGTLEVHPLKTYGAVELGAHRFTHPNDPSNGSGDAKFIILWKNNAGHWLVTRVISYDHDLPVK